MSRKPAVQNGFPDRKERPGGIRRLVPLIMGAAVACEGSSGPITGPGGHGLGRTLDVPSSWTASLPMSGGSYTIGTDRLLQHGGAAAAYLSGLNPTPAPTEIASLFVRVRADHYRGRRVRWRGWLRPSQIAGPGAGLWMSVHGPGELQAYDNMIGTRPVKGTSGWVLPSVVLDVPANAIGVSMGVTLAGAGDLVVDDFSFDTVGMSVATTDQLTGPEASGLDSAGTVALYDSAPDAPVNLDFEGAPAPAPVSLASLAGPDTSRTSRAVCYRGSRPCR